MCLGRAERVLYIHDGAARQPQQVDRTLRNTRFISVRLRHDDILVFDDAFRDGHLDLALPALPFLASEFRGCPTSVRQLSLTRIFLLLECVLISCIQASHISRHARTGRVHFSFVRGRSVAMGRCRGPGQMGVRSLHGCVQGEGCGAAGAVNDVPLLMSPEPKHEAGPTTTMLPPSTP